MSNKNPNKGFSYLIRKFANKTIYSLQIFLKLIKRFAGRFAYLLKKVGQYFVIGAMFVVAFVRNHFLLPLHRKLLKKWGWYRSWNSSKYSNKVHSAAAATFLLIALVVVSSTFYRAFAAPDLTDTWDFSNPNQFTFDAGVEPDGTTARLKAQNYESDANTSALYHFDESNGSTASDSSSNANNATSSNPPTFTTGNLNNAAQFDGINNSFITSDSASISPNFANTLEAWTKLDRTFTSSSDWQDQTIVDKGSFSLRYDHTTGKLAYEMANNGATTWTQVGGDDINNSWENPGKFDANATVNDGTNLYVGIGGGTSGGLNAEVWRWNGSIWAKIGGDGVNGSWNSGEHERVMSLALDGSKLYAGLGANSIDAEVWQFENGSWTKIGGDNLNSGWGTNPEDIMSMTVMNNQLYVGQGRSTNDARVYRWNGSTWQWVGGFGVSGFTAFPTGYEAVTSLANDGTNVYAGMENGTGDADVWMLNGTTWTQIGGDNLNSGWAASTNEYVHSLHYFGGNLYAGIGAGGGDGELWIYNGSTWSKLGGDGTNSSWATANSVRSITNDGTNIFVGLGDSVGLTEVWRWSGSAWSQIGGDTIGGSFLTFDNTCINTLSFMDNKLFAGTCGAGAYIWKYEGGSWSVIGGQGANQSWGVYDLQSISSMVSWNGKLYAGGGVGETGNAVIWEFDGSNWQVIGGQGNRGSWSLEHEIINTMVVYKGELYAGLGNATGDAEVWKYNGSTWSRVAGDGTAWTGTYENVLSMAVHNDDLYIGLGNNNVDGDVWRYDGSAWSQIGGDGISGSWTTTAVDQVLSMVSYRGDLYIGGGAGTGDAEVWRYSGGSWARVGGDGTGWADAAYETIYSMAVHGDKLCAGLGNGGGDAEVWCYDQSSWTQIGGDGLNSGWTANETVYTLTSYNGDLYAGLGYSSVYSELWRYRDGTWTKVGGQGTNLSWPSSGNAIEAVESMAVHDGKLFVGTGRNTNVDAQVWAYGNNAVLQSSTNSFNTDWRHVAATYDGTSMKIYINGQLDASKNVSNLMPDTNHSLRIGSGYGSRTPGTSNGEFKGLIDELRISNIARTSFTSKPYLSTRQTITLNDAVRTAGIAHWDNFSANETTNGGAITYRLSADDGASWLYWNGSNWVTSNSLSEANTAGEIDGSIIDFPVTFNGLKWQAILYGDGDQRVTLNSITAESTSDVDSPSANASNLLAFKNNGGDSIAIGAWTNSGSPYFTWDAGVDSGAGIAGYCIYVGQDSGADPVTTAGLLGASPVETGGNCQFMVNSNQLDLSTSGYLQTALTTSNDPYYVSIKAIDKAGNISPNSAQFNFRFDNTPPTNPAYITAPSGFITSKDFTMTWPNSGGNGPSDGNSGLAGLQYRIGNTTWYGDAHSGSGNIDDLLTNDGTYTTQDPIDFNNLIDGINTIYFRTWDQAGNVSNTYTTATVRINTAGAPTEPQNVNVNPTTNTNNLFAFSWDAPASYAGDENTLTYCYTVNTLPSPNTCSFTTAGITSLGAGPYATQPGSNTFYVVARDEANNINYSSYGSVTFTANTPSPGIPTNTDVVDVSVKATSNWRLAVTWDVPVVQGAGITSYRVYRSTDNTTFTQVGSSSSTTYVDSGLSQQRYYYYVRACDNTNNCGANSTTVNEVPTGRFTEPANMVSPPVVSGITTKKATITWGTDRESDSRIALGTSSGNYGPSEVAVSQQTTAHKVELDNLSAGTTYYYIAKWTDEDGNTGQSQEYVFQTSPAPSLKEITTVRVGLSSALIQFTSRDAVRASVVYGKTESFGGSVTINTSASESTYAVELNDLEDGSKYYYKIITYDNEGTAYSSSVFSFTTPARPAITNLRFQPIEGEPTSTQKVTWNTNVPANSSVSYGKLNGGSTDILDVKPVLEHEIIIRGLEDNSDYFLVAQSRDANGVLASSDRQIFKTALDTRPPKVYDVTIEPSIKGAGSDARGQVVVSWKTDEPAASQVGYTEGSDKTVFNNKTVEDSELTTEHIVIVSDLPTSRVYSIQPMSKDSSGNVGVGEVESTIVGRATDNILTIVLTSLQRIFGF